MSNVSYMASRRQGTRAGVAPGSVRISVTLKESVFLALRARADASAHAVAGEAADIITAAVAPAEADEHQHIAAAVASLEGSQA